MRVAVAALLLALVGTAAATPPACRHFPGYDGNELPVTARVRATAGDRVHFHDDREGCPDGEGCARRAYLVAGDDVVVDRVADGWACAWFDGPRVATIGWMRADALALAPLVTDMPPAAWVGDWDVVEPPVAGTDGPTRTLRFRLRDGELDVVGEAIWVGPVLESGDRVVHAGDIEVDALAVDDATAGFAPPGEYECAATFRRVGDYVLADDNGYCGGMNVTFDGIYRRVRTQAPR